jgi:hypothetical protein
VNNMNTSINELDVVALLEDIPAENLWRGDIGTIVDALALATISSNSPTASGRPTQCLPFVLNNFLFCTISITRKWKRKVEILSS